MERLTINFDENYVPKKLCTINRFGELDDCDRCPGDDGNCEGDCDYCPVQECFNKLAEYENTGATPEMIRNFDQLYLEKCKEVERYKKLSLGVEEMAKLVVILEEFKRMKKGEKLPSDEKQPQTRLDLEMADPKEGYARMFIYFRKLLVDLCAKECETES